MATITLHAQAASGAPTTVNYTLRKKSGGSTTDSALTTSTYRDLRDEAAVSATAFDAEAIIALGTFYTNMPQTLKDATYNVFLDLTAT